MEPLHFLMSSIIDAGTSRKMVRNSLLTHLRIKCVPTDLKTNFRDRFSTYRRKIEQPAESASGLGMYEMN